ncbi:hypothetical protein [Streptomyces vietnamensis]|uniref:Uncharacterized protein n=1 Tax=Streptomyces vietnamensis TaxID=362257 RepID=A0A0B5IIV0_9ACTN|nr:hypothetical protein [Streptomyces vietnamensis]AJF70397.1 hypothetical protein SVTN_40120 [Streptomyces vietnamensis]
MTATRTLRAAPHAAAGPKGHGGASPGPATASCEPARLVEHIGAAVRAGDDSAIRRLLHQLAGVADTDLLLLLHHRLNEDLHR